jgi:hypothetical protein
MFFLVCWEMAYDDIIVKYDDLDAGFKLKSFFARRQ